MPDEWNQILQQPLVEEHFDPTWKFNFKWGYNAKTNVVHVWRVQGGTDGRPTHRAELAALWGREPKVGEGDVLGLATYIPAERKLDGTLVAPPEVRVQAYYGQPVPQGVYEWFEEHFPGSVARQAQIALPRLGASVWDDIQQPDASQMRVLKWAWNRNDGALLWEPDDEGLPTHAMKIMSQWGRPEGAQDFVGFAVWEPGKVEMEDYNTGNPAPPQAHQVIKQELSQMFPHDEIVLPDVPQHEFGGNPQILGRRMSAAEWAQTTLAVTSHDPQEALESPVETTHVAGTTETPDSPGRVIPGLVRLFKKKSVFSKQAEADTDGAMVGIFLPKETAKKLHLKGGEPVEQLHITLLYFKDKAADRDDWDEVARITEQIANQTPTLKGKISGYGMFQNDVDVLWASPSIQGLAELRHKLFEACEDAGFPVSTDHDWAPHITLKYDFKGKLPKIEDPIEFKLDTLSFARGEDHDDFKFEGSFEKKAMSANPQWVQRWIVENGPYLYHGSGGRAWAGDAMNILKNGIVPRQTNNPVPMAEDYDWTGLDPSKIEYPSDYDSNMNEWWHEPRPGHVYLVTDPEAAYGHHLFRVDIRGLDPQHFNPDDDYLRETGDTVGPLLLPGVKYRNMPDSPFQTWDEVRQHLKTLGQQAEEQGWGDNPEDTHNSWEAHPVHPGGVVAYRGAIPPHLIEHVASREGHYDPWEWKKMAHVDDFDWSMPENEYWGTNPTTGYNEEWGPQTWSGWQGAHRFVTDGKEILTEPEEDLRLEGKGWHGQGHPELEQKFKRFYPDSKGLVSGWVVPTADEMGYGIFAPSAGFGGPHEPGLEDVMKMVDKHFDKPSHFVNDLHVVKDPKLYRVYPEGGHFVGFTS